MIDIVDSALQVHPTIVPKLFVDDLSAEADGGDEYIILHLCGFTRLAVAGIQADGMEISLTKSLFGIA